MRVFYADQFVLPLPPGHRFPMEKYRLLRDRLAAEVPDIPEPGTLSLASAVMALKFRRPKRAGIPVG